MLTFYINMTKTLNPKVHRAEYNLSGNDVVLGTESWDGWSLQKLLFGSPG